MATKHRTHGTVIAEESNRDPDFRVEWERTALARLVAAQILDYRASHSLSQRALAERLGVKQPYVTRLESGEVNPEIDTLVNISRSLGIEFMIDIAPVTRAPKLVTKKVREKHEAQHRDGVSVVFAAAAS